MSLHYFLVFTTNLFLLHKTTYRHKEVDTSLCELQCLFYILKCLAAPDYHTVDAGGATSCYNGKQILDRFLMIMANMSPSLSHSSSITYKESNIWIRSSIQRTSCTTFNALPSLLDKAPRFSIRRVIWILLSDTETSAATPPGVIQKK